MRHPKKLAILLIACWLPSVFPCGSDVKGLKPGSEFMAIQKGETGEWVLDDSGMFNAILLVSHCADYMEDAAVRFNDTQKECIKKYNDDNKLEYPEAVPDYAFYDHNLAPMKAIHNTAVRNACGIDILSEFDKSVAFEDNKPLSCAKKGKIVAEKAAARYREFNLRDSDPEYLKSLSITDEDARQHIMLNADKQKALDDLAALMKQAGNRKAFTPLLERFKVLIATEQFPLVNGTEEGMASEYMQPAEDLINQFGSRTFGFGSRCASGVTEDMIDKLVEGSWLPMDKFVAPDDGGERAVK
jgi:hypothetical protein